MYPVLISDVEKVIQLYKERFLYETKDAVTRLYSLMAEVDEKKKPKFSAYEQEYLELLAGFLPDIIFASPSQLEKYQKILDNKISSERLSTRKMSALSKGIINALGYSSLRETLYPSYFNSIGIKVCVYCNTQLAVCVEKEPGTGKYRAKFQLDHYYPKSTNPGLSISLFNLYPVCANCNIVKGKKEVFFRLYGEELKDPGFVFGITDEAVANFFVSENPNDIVLTFKEPLPPRGAESFNSLFNIKAIYDTQKDIAEELLLKKIMYTKLFNETIATELKDLFHDKHVVYRMITGNYINEHEVHKRPLAKFMRDLAKQIKLI